MELSIWYWFPIFSCHRLDTTISGSTKQESNEGSRLFKGGAKSFSKRWQTGEISNFQYLMHLNTLAGRGYSDLTQYPVFPWVLSDYESEDLDLLDPKTFRRLDKPMGCQTIEGEDEFRKRYFISINFVIFLNFFFVHNRLLLLEFVAVQMILRSGLLYKFTCQHVKITLMFPPGMRAEMILRSRSFIMAPTIPVPESFFSTFYGCLHSARRIRSYKGGSLTTLIVFLTVLKILGLVRLGRVTHQMWRNWSRNFSTCQNSLKIDSVLIWERNNQEKRWV